MNIGNLQPDELPPSSRDVSDVPSLSDIPPESSRWNWRGPYDRLIFLASGRQRTLSALLKAIAEHESGQNPLRVNPERAGISESYVLGLIRAGGELPDRLNPSIGFLQIRFSTARNLEPGVTAHDLLDVGMNLRVGFKLMDQLQRAGIRLETIDAWNVGQDLEPRNLPYRDNIVRLFNGFVEDFPPDGANVV